jgi:hypothetical protein
MGMDWTIGCSRLLRNVGRRLGCAKRPYHASSIRHMLAAQSGIDPLLRCCFGVMRSYGNITATAAQSDPSSNGWEVKNWEPEPGTPPSLPECPFLGWIEEAIGWRGLSPRGSTVCYGVTALARATTNEDME